MNRRWVALLLYDVLLALVGISLIPFVLFRAVRSPDFRRSLPGRLGFAEPLPASEKRVLLHGVSVGEVKALKPLVMELRRQFPQRSLVVSSSTPTGLATARQLFPDLPVVAYPLDLPGTCRRFLKRVKPNLVILAELEIWPNFLNACFRQDIKVSIVNGRITDRSLAGYRRVQNWLPQFERISLYGVQSQRYAERFSGLDVPKERVVVTGNLKYDNLPTGEEDAHFATSCWARWQSGPPLVVWASTHEPEETSLFKQWLSKQQTKEAVLVIVPRHPRRCPKLIPELKRMAEGRELGTFSEWGSREKLPAGSVLVVDAFGQLEMIYRAAQMAFVGGSLIEHGGQNVLEPAVFQVPMVVGPHMENFLEEVACLKQADALKSVINAAEVVECLLSWLQHPEIAQETGGNGAKALETRRGASQSTVLALQQADLL
ncbi:MAG: 3-deoxy-D-manno-octulosonic acid transferase [Planctomycetota bacterium]|nr:3-deoxy-D-manno-octulosonic acid transferase [Planctomycetota bacterium]MDA1112915.1 3-deoxy-D-manno-octulosonic acid transferase [Planctomycetota bacterium]